MYRARLGRWVLLPALPGALRLGEKGSSVSGTAETRRPLTGPGQRPGPRPPALPLRPMRANSTSRSARSLSLLPRSPRGPCAAGSGRCPAPRAREGRAGSAGWRLPSGALVETLPPLQPPAGSCDGARAFVPGAHPSPPPLSCRSLPGPSPACPGRLRLFFLYYPRRIGGMRPLSPPPPESRCVGIEVFPCLASFLGEGAGIGMWRANFRTLCFCHPVK